jgi:zinc protease
MKELCPGLPGQVDWIQVSNPVLQGSAMTLRPMSRVGMVIVLAALCGAALSAQGTAPAPAAGAAMSPAADNSRIAIDSSITVGRLPNGIRYYIKANNRPENRAELRLVINAGSVLEDDDQRGLAHFVEHMAFNGSKHFAKQEIGAFMEAIGMRFGPSLNAFTGFDDTTYVMQVPTNRPGIMERAFLVMEDWARNLTFDHDEIDKERGVIIEEWRLNRGATARMQDQVMPILLKGSRYSERIPIGTKESLEKFPYDRLIRFYRDWYRPDLMAVVAVGDFNPTAVEQMIKERFSAIPPALLARPRPNFEVPVQPGTSYAVITDKEMPAATIALYNKLPMREQATVSSYRQRIVDHLYAGMLNDRLAELSQKPDPPFIAANVDRSIFIRTLEAASFTAIAQPAGIERALEAMIVESERLARYGFTPAEFEREKRSLLRVYEQAVTEKATQDSAPLAEEYIRNFLVDESIPGIAWEYEQHQKFLPGITLDEVNALAHEWYGDRNRVVVVFAPDKPGLAVPDEKKLASIIAAAGMKKIDAPVDAVHTDVLLGQLPEPGTITKSAVREDLGITDLTLSNGVRVILKPTTFKKDEILFRAFSPGGTSLAPDASFVPAMTAAQVVAAGGVGPFDLSAMRKVLAGKLVSVTPTIGETHEGMAGTASAKDVETMFQLLYLQFTQPRRDPAVFRVMVDQMKGLSANRQAMPNTAFEELVDTTMAQGHLRARPLSPEVISEMDLDKSMAFYKDRFADASDFTFVFVGSFDVEAMKPLVARYLGSLPALHRTESWKDVGITPPKGVVEKTLRKGIEPKSRVRLIFSGPFNWTLSDRVALDALTMVLEGQLGLVLREEQSGTYGVQVESSADRLPTPQFELSVDFGCAPERSDELVKLAVSEMTRFRFDGPTAKHVADTREAMLRKWETDSQENGFILDQIAASLQFGDNPRAYLDLPSQFRMLTPEMLQRAAQLYLDPRNYVRVTLYPEK